jgi:hypothetical protein
VVSTLCGRRASLINSPVVSLPSKSVALAEVMLMRVRRIGDIVALGIMTYAVTVAAVPLLLEVAEGGGWSDRSIALSYAVKSSS